MKRQWMIVVGMMLAIGAAAEARQMDVFDHAAEMGSPRGASA